MTRFSRCPPEALLSSFLLGNTTEEDSQKMSEHLQNCRRCAEQAEQSNSTDILTSSLIQSNSIVPIEEPIVRSLIERIQALHRTKVASQDQTLLVDEIVEQFSPPSEAGDLGCLGGYRVVRPLGIGGMGIVFEGVDSDLRREVALKVMKKEIAASRRSRERFLREGHSMARVEHDNIATVYQVGEENGIPFLAMQKLTGETLDSRLKRGDKLSLRESLRIARETAQGLAAAHEQGLIHRDIKPGNLWLDANASDRVKILDFGLARAEDGHDQITQTGCIAGTPAFMAPEQGRGESPEPRSDLFSLGCVLYRLVTGRLPFEGSDAISTMLAVASHRPTPPKKLNPKISARLNELILQLLARNPEDRLDSAQEVADRLRELEADLDTGRVERAPSIRIGKWLIAGTLMLVTLGLLFGGTVVRFVTNRGVLEIKVDDPNIDVVIKRDNVTVQDKTSKRRFTLSAKSFMIEVYEKNGIGPLLTKQFKLNRGGKTTVTITMRELAHGRLPDDLPKFSEVKTPTWKPGPPDTRSGAMVPFPRTFEGIRRWQIATVSGPPLFTKWNPDGKLIAIAFNDLLAVTDADTAETRFLVPRSDRFEWSPDGKWLATLDETQGQLRIYSKEGKLSTTPKGRLHFRIEGKVQNLKWSPRSDRLVVYGKKAVIISPTSAKTIKLKSKGEFFDARWSKDGKTLITCNNCDPEITHWNRNGKKVDTIDTMHRGQHLHPDGKHALSLEKGALDCKPLLREPLKKVGYFAWSPNKKILAVSVDTKLILLNRKLEQQKSIALPSAADYFLWRPDGSGMLLNYQQHSYYVSILEEKITKLEDHLPPTGFHRDGPYRLYSWSRDGSAAAIAVRRLFIYRFNGQTPRRSVLTPYRFSHAHPRWSPTADRFAVRDGGLHVGVKMYDSRAKFQGNLTSDQIAVRNVRVSPKGDRFAVNSDDRRLQLFSLEGQLLETIYPRGGIGYFDWHRDGRHIVYWYNRRVRVLDLKTKKVVAERAAGSAKSAPVEFEPTKGDLIAIVTGLDCELWEWRNGQKIVSSFNIKASGVTWSRDGKAVLVWGAQGAYLHDLSGKRLTTFGPGGGWAYPRWNQDGSHVLILTEHDMRWFRRDGSLLETLRITRPYGLSPDDSEVPGTMSLKRKPVPPYHPSPVHFPRFSPNGKVMISSALLNPIRVWSTKTRRLKCQILLLPDEQSVVLSEAGEVLYATKNSLEQLVYVVEEKSGETSLLKMREFYKRFGMMK